MTNFFDSFTAPALKIGVSVGALLASRAYETFKEAVRTTEFLNYDTNYLIDCYNENGDSVSTHLPYAEQGRLLRAKWDDFTNSFNNLQIEKIPTQFELAKEPPELSDFQTHALAQFQKDGRVDRNDRVVRLAAYDRDKQVFRVQQCMYKDGLRSNYAMDLKGHLNIASCDVTLRAILQVKYGRKLPPLDDRTLSNAIGIAVVLFYKTEDNDILPYLPRRWHPLVSVGTAKKQAVFQGGFHCTASGETLWRDDASTFDTLFTEDICRELKEEVEITRDDLEWIYPIAFCREFLRGGKPQLFFAGYTKLPPREINSRRLLAIDNQKRRGRQEIDNEALIVETPDKLYQELWSHGTMEAVTNIAFAQDFAILAKGAGQF